VDGRETTAEVVVFQVEGRSYALPLEQVVEVLRMVAVTPLPEAPPWVAGVVNLRGTLIPMIDLRPRLGMARTEVDPSHVFVVAQARGRTVGVLADEVQDVVQLAGGPDASAAAVVIVNLERLLDGAELGDWDDRIGGHVGDAAGVGDDLSTRGLAV
jgi:chemotaxis signal transduction protein